MSKKKLTDKQQQFVEEYLVDLNVTQAALRAGYSEKTAYSIGHENLKKPEVQEAIQRAVQERQERTRVTADRVIQELARIGFADFRNVFDESGNLKDPTMLDEETAAAISSIEVVTKNLGEGEVEYINKIKFWDKNSSLEKLGRHLKLFTDKVDATIKGEPLTIEKDKGSHAKD
jgi:phage terminase small subunit